MDTVSHGIAGAVLARTLTGRPGARPALLFGLVAAMFPDIDFLFVSGRMAYLRNHRGWTHSFLVMPVFALGLALVARLVFRHARVTTLWLFCAVGIVSHILFDWITSFGIMFFIPLTRARYALDWVFILDPFFTGIFCVTLLAAVLFRARGREVAMAGTCLLLAYVAFCSVEHGRALEAWKRMDAPPPGARTAVLPQFLSPFRWLGLTERADEVHLAFFDVGPFARGVPNPRPPERFSEILRGLSDFYPPPGRATVRRLARPRPTPLLAAARALPDVATYLAFARFPFETVAAQPDGGVAITWEDLRFLPWFAGPWGAGRGGLRRQPFVYRVRLDAAGRPVERAFVTESPRAP